MRTEMNEKINANTEELKDQRKTIETVVKRVDLLDKSKEQGNKDVFREIRERESRADNLVIYQVPEPPASLTRGGDKKKHDIEKVLELFEHLECSLDNTAFKFIYRAGERKDSDRPRPLIMCLNDPGARQYILANTRKLSNSRYSNVSIVPDLTHQQRKEEEELRKEADTLNKALTNEEFLNWEWVLIGVRGKRTLIKRRKFQHGEEERRPVRMGINDQRRHIPEENPLRSTVRPLTRGGQGAGGRGGRGRGGGERESSRGGRRMEQRLIDTSEREISSQTLAPTTVDMNQKTREGREVGGMRREEELETQEEAEEGQESISNTRPRGVIPMEEEGEGEEEEVVEEDGEATNTRTGRKKRGRGDLSISPPQQITKKKTLETSE